MTNAELIAALRYCSDNEREEGCDECPYLHNGMCRSMLSDAAYALEAAEQRIAELEAQIDELTTKRAVMDRREYELLQVELSKLLNKRLWCGRNEEQGYRNGVRAAKSKLKEVFYAQEEVQT